MDLPKLLLDATGALPGSPRRSQCARLVDIIAQHPGDLPAPTLNAVVQWFKRGSIPGERLRQIAVAATAFGRPIDIRDY